MTITINNNTDTINPLNEYSDVQIDEVCNSLQFFQHKAIFELFPKAEIEFVWNQQDSEITVYDDTAEADEERDRMEIQIALEGVFETGQFWQ